MREEVSKSKSRYAVVGTGGRSIMFIEPIATTYRDVAELVGMCDPNPARLELYNRRLVEEMDYHAVPTFAAEDFDKMIEQTRPDVVIVTTVDALHEKYIVRAMELGCDVVTEKPMTTDDVKCRAIFDAIERTGRKLRVTFNYRWTPGTTQVWKLLREGVIGDILHVDMQWLLNTDHGADYFRRWHREKDKSGGLMVHKATHHFDIINWWIDAVPQEVFAYGRLAFYGRENAERRGEQVTYDRYTGHDTGGDPFALSLDSNDTMKAMYLDAEKHDGYIRDRNVFGDDISIEDTMSVLVKYRTGVVLNYSLNAFLPREGLQVAINGTKGRLEYNEHHSAHVIAGQNSEQLAAQMHWDNRLIVLPMFGEPYEVPIEEAQGGHGGGDPLIQQQIFDPNAPREMHGRNAGHEQGAASILIGIAANQCFEHGKPVKIADLCPQLGDAARLSELS